MDLEFFFHRLITQVDLCARSRLTKQYANFFKQFANTCDPMTYRNFRLMPVVENLLRIASAGRVSVPQNVAAAP